MIILNADKVVLTGNKMADKTYVWHTGYPGGQRTTNPEQMMAKFPERVVEKAVKGMLPKIVWAPVVPQPTRLCRREHKHEAQKPTAININEINK